MINLVNGKTYIGSSLNLKRRLKEYLNPLYITRNLKKGNSAILKALLKYGPLKFNFKVLETVEARKRLDLSISKSEIKKIIVTKEQYYMDLIKPEYNLNPKAGSNFGRIFSEEIRKKMSLSKLGKPGNKKGAILSENSKVLFREKSGKALAVNMLNDNNELIASFKSIQIASEVTGIHRNRISRCARGIRKSIIENGKIYRFEFANTLP